MKKLLFVVAVMLVIFAAFPMNKAHAFVLLDFEDISRDDTPGDYSHSVSTVYGDIDFNGRVWYRIQDKDVPDHTLGTTEGSFLKNTIDKKKITMDFGFDVLSIEAWTVVYKGNNSLTAKAFDIDGNLLQEKEIGPAADGWKDWENTINFSSTKAQPIRKLVLTGSKKQNFGIDDIKISAVPEPATLSLLGIGLLGAIGAGFRRKNKK